MLLKIDNGRLVNLCYLQCCYVAVNSKPDHPPWANPQEMFLKGQILHPPGTKKVPNPDPWGRKIVLRPHHRGNYFRKTSKKTQNIS